MRVIAGEARGRPLKAVPGTGTRPTTDKVKEAVFSMIGPYFDGGRVLDLFAGTGGLGIEALSRGADRAIFIDSDRQAAATVKRNLEAVGMTARAEVYVNAAERALKLLEKRGEPFRLVFLDPPYRLKHADALMGEMEARGLLEPDAIVVVEHEAGHEYPETFGGFARTRLSAYGDTAVAIYRYAPQGATEGDEKDAAD